MDEETPALKGRLHIFAPCVRGKFEEMSPEEQAALLSYFGPGPGAGWLASLLSSLWVVAGLVATAVAVPVVLDDDDETGVVSPPY